MAPPIRRGSDSLNYTISRGTQRETSESIFARLCRIRGRRPHCRDDCYRNRSTKHYHFARSGQTWLQTGSAQTFQDPSLELHDRDGAVFWLPTTTGGRTRRLEIIATSLQPANDLDAAIVTALPAGNYTAIVRGTGNSTEWRYLSPSATMAVVGQRFPHWINCDDGVVKSEAYRADDAIDRCERRTLVKRQGRSKHTPGQSIPGLLNSVISRLGQQSYILNSQKHRSRVGRRDYFWRVSA